jgi:hypothetical protein
MTRGVAAAFVWAIAVGACDTNHKELADSACKRLASCGESVPQGCCVDCNPSPKISMSYACARSISAAPTCNKALEFYNARACLERPR